MYLYEYYFQVHCENYPWMVEPGRGKYLFIKVRGHMIPEPKLIPENESNSVISEPACLTRNRIVIYSSGKLRAVVCPHSPKRTATVEVFSEGWDKADNTSGLDEKTRRLLVEFVAREPGSYAVSWLEVSPLKRRHGPLILPPSDYMSGMEGLKLEHCAHRCPELEACINATLFCDGRNHCPSGFDESSEFCAPYLLRLPQLLYVAVGVLGLLALCITLSIGSCKACYRRRKKQARMKLLLPPGSAGKDLAIC